MNLSGKRPDGTDERVENLIGNLLRIGVLSAAAVVLLGGCLYLVRYGASMPHYHVFKGEPSDLRSIWGIIKDAFELHTRGIIQLGFLVLIATPIMRVAVSVAAFLYMRDRLYVAVSLLVLCLLLYSFLIGSL
jgi:uncharacterized membrane protein